MCNYGNKSKKSKKNKVLTEILAILFLLCIWLFVEGGGVHYRQVKNIILNETISMKNVETLNFDNINGINIKMDNCNLTITEADGDLIEVTSTIKNSGIGIVTQPILWVKDNILHYDQGIKSAMNLKSIGELTVKVPRNLNLNYDVCNEYGDVFLDVNLANDLNLDICYGNLELLTKAENLNIDSENGNINIFEASKNVNVNTKSGHISILANEFTNYINFVSERGTCIVFAENMNDLNNTKIESDIKSGNLQFNYKDTPNDFFNNVK